MGMDNCIKGNCDLNENPEILRVDRMEKGQFNNCLVMSSSKTDTELRINPIFSYFQDFCWLGLARFESLPTPLRATRCFFSNFQFSSLSNGLFLVFLYI